MMKAARRLGDRQAINQQMNPLVTTKNKIEDNDDNEQEEEEEEEEDSWKVPTMWFRRLWKSVSTTKDSQKDDFVVDGCYATIPNSESAAVTEERFQQVMDRIYNRKDEEFLDDKLLQVVLGDDQLASKVETLEFQHEARMNKLQKDLQQEIWNHQRTREKHRQQIDQLQSQIQALETKNNRLQSKLQRLKQQQQQQQHNNNNNNEEEEEMVWHAPTTSPTESLEPVTKLSNDQVERYSRHLLLREGFGVEGQCKLLSSSVLVVGAGGIGSTVLLYLAACGIGRLTVMDFDCVERSNLHRQVIHGEDRVGTNKALSARRSMQNLNPAPTVQTITEPLTHENALALVSAHDCIVDASDNPLTRYLLNDACVLANKPLVSGSAIETEGQLTVYCHQGPCYRCLYPQAANASKGCKSCSDNGVLGPVPGLIGVLQSLEVLKILTGTGRTMSDRLLMYDSLQCSFMNIKKPPRSKKCPVCGENPTILTMQDSYRVSSMARGPNANVLPHEEDDENVLRVSCKEYDRIRNTLMPHVLLDVRVTRQYDMCHLDGSINIPLADILNQQQQQADKLQDDLPIYCLCRRGILSVQATKILSCHYSRVYNIEGGLQAWSQQVDPSFPIY